MATQLQLRKGTTAAHSTFVGALAEVTVDTDRKAVVVHDGVTPGGFPSAPLAHTHTPAQVGLGNVDNTSDANKPISIATQAALNAKYDASNPAGYITASGNAANVTGIVAVANGGTGVTTATGTGSVVRSSSPTLVSPALGTPSSVTLTNATGLPLTSGVSGVLPVANGGTLS